MDTTSMMASVMYAFETTHAIIKHQVCTAIGYQFS